MKYEEFFLLFLLGNCIQNVKSSILKNRQRVTKTLKRIYGRKWGLFGQLLLEIYEGKRDYSGNFTSYSGELGKCAYTKKSLLFLKTYPSFDERHFTSLKGSDPFCALSHKSTSPAPSFQNTKKTGIHQFLMRIFHFTAVNPLPFCR
jgi:hypothetical protein